MQISDRWAPLRHHPTQQALINTRSRFVTVPAGRRSGKTEIAKRHVVRKTLEGSRFYPPRFFAAAPTWQQAKRIFWGDLKALMPKQFIAPKGISESELMMRLVTGAELYVVGLDKPERIEGQPWDGGIITEFGNVKPNAWAANIRPVMSDRHGWCWLEGVPEGRNHYYEIDLRAQAVMKEAEAKGEVPEWASYHWISADILDPAEIASAKADLDELTYLQEYEASFINFSGRAYYNFDERRHVQHLKYDPTRSIGFCFDFNVAPGVAVVVQEQILPGMFEEVYDPDEGKVVSVPVFGTGVIGEVHIPNNSNTQIVCRKLVNDWKQHRALVYCYGDASGGARGTAKVSGSDWELIRDELYKGFGDRVRFRVPSANPPERQRVNAVNSRLLSASGVVRMVVDGRKAPHVVKDLEGVRVILGGSGEIDKKTDERLTHISDALGYYVAREFPITKRSVGKVELINRY